MADNKDSRWTCPSCFRCFAEVKNLRDHLDFDKLVVRRLLKDLMNALCQTECPAYKAELRFLGDPIKEPAEELAEKPAEEPAEKPPAGQSTRLADYELHCPDQNCRNKKPFSKKTNLLRHYRVHVNCNVKCACNAVYPNVDIFFRHLNSCRLMEDTHTKSSKTTAQQWEMIGLKEHLLDQVRLELEQRLGTINDNIASDRQPRLEEGDKEMESEAESAHILAVIDEHWKESKTLGYPPHSSKRRKKRKLKNAKRDVPFLAEAAASGRALQQLQTLSGENDQRRVSIPDQPVRAEYEPLYVTGEQGNMLSLKSPARHDSTGESQQRQSEVLVDQQINWEQRANSNFTCPSVLQIEDNELIRSTLLSDPAMAVFHPPDIWPDFDPRNAAIGESATAHFFDPTIWPSDTAYNIGR